MVSSFSLAQFAVTLLITSMTLGVTVLINTDNEITIEQPTVEPTIFVATPSPTIFPTVRPTLKPTFEPTTGKPTRSPTMKPTETPTVKPTDRPTSESDPPTQSPVILPTISPTTSSPTSSVENVIDSDNQIVQLNSANEFTMLLSDEQFDTFTNDGIVCKIVKNTNSKTDCVLSESLVSKMLSITVPNKYHDDSFDILLNGELIRENLRVGKVFLCAGQSNMHHTVEDDVAADVINSTPNGGKIYMFKYASQMHPNYIPWNRDNVNDFSSVCYTFALQYMINNPDINFIGLVDNSIGSTSLDQWMPQSVATRPKPKVSSSAGEHWIEFMEPLLHLEFEAFLWSHGDANAEFPANYGLNLPIYINEVRTQLNQPDLPVLIVEMCTYIVENRGNIVQFRTEQYNAAQTMSNIGYVRTYDIGYAYQHVNKPKINTCSMEFYGHDDWCKDTRFSFNDVYFTIHSPFKAMIGYRLAKALQNLDNYSIDVASCERNTITTGDKTGQYEFTFKYTKDIYVDITRLPNSNQVILWKRTSDSTFKRTTNKIVQTDIDSWSIVLDTANVDIYFLNHANPCCDETALCAPEACEMYTKDSNTLLPSFQINVANECVLND